MITNLSPVKKTQKYFLTKTENRYRLVYVSLLKRGETDFKVLSAMSSLEVTFSNKTDDLLLKLLEIMKKVDFYGQEPLIDPRLTNLLKRFRDGIQFAIEFPYVDRHYRDTYYFYYSSKFKEIGRDCIRVHIFHGEITKDDLTNKDADFENKKYLGFFIIRPLARYTLGRSLISPEALNENNFVCCLTRDRISLLGNEFTVYGFPHVAQDAETHTCAESSLWSFIEYYGSKYSQYKPLLPSQIIKELLNNIEHRPLPSEGLTEKELAKCLKDNNFQCKTYSIHNTINNTIFRRMLQIYIESGIPLLLIMDNTKDGHAVLVIGHEEDEIYDITKHPFLSYAPWVDVSFYSKKLVFIDDNMPPYQIADVSEPTAHYSDPRFNNMVITSFIVPLPVHVFLVAEKAYDLMKEIINTKGMSLKETGEKWITRLLLTKSHSFKNFINRADKIIETDKITCEEMPRSIKEELLYLALPRFIWIVELYRAQNYSKNNGYCSGLLIMDATGSGKKLMLKSVLWYALNDRQFTHNNISWDRKYKPIEPFKMGTYRNNLKGEWNGWKS